MAVYRFRGADRVWRWPRAGGFGLGACGMWNFLWRLGFHPRQVDQSPLPRPTGNDVLFAQLDSTPSAQVVEAVREWIDRGGRLVASGSPEAWNVVGLFGRWRNEWPHNPYCGLAYRLNGSTELVAPARWLFGRLDSASEAARRIGQIVLVGGERQTPWRALLSPVSDAPAAIVSADSRTCFLNANPFAALQSWLQGQEDLQTWFAWRHRLFWLDEWVSTIASLLSDVKMLALDVPRPGIAGLDATTVVLRHDVDHSRDTSYLEEELHRNVAASYAVLDDRNAGFWVRTLAAHPGHETAFHYTTGRRDWVATASALARWEKRGSMKPAVRQVAGRGLLQQVRRARALGIGIRTLHRHLLFLPYPEWIDALDAVFEAEPEVLGASSLFRAQVLRWGGRASDGQSASTGEWPDAQFPLWLPFKLSHAAAGGRRLRGWESTSLMEVEPDLACQLLDHRVAHVPQRVLTFAFHPVHANAPTFSPHGSIGSFRSILSLLAERHVPIRPLREVYELADRAAASA